METFHYVYLLNSVAHPNRYYVGSTSDLKARLAKHNRGEVFHTSKSVPWKIKTAIAFTDREKGIAFERYLKSPSGRAFAKKRL
jgi:predicted GIY-YIG superfamily endonuclease